jgi:hypothetical protein
VLGLQICTHILGQDSWVYKYMSFVRLGKSVITDSYFVIIFHLQIFILTFHFFMFFSILLLLHFHSSFKHQLNICWTFWFCLRGPWGSILHLLLLSIFRTRYFVFVVNLIESFSIISVLLFGEFSEFLLQIFCFSVLFGPFYCFSTGKKFTFFHLFLSYFLLC